MLMAFARILGITPGISFLGHPTPPRLTAWSPAPALPERALDGFPRSVHPFFVALGRYYTPCPTYRMETIYGCTKWPNGDNSLLGLPINQVWQVPTHDAYAPSSKILSIATCSGRRHFWLALIPFSPLHSDVVQPPVADDQSPAVG